MNLQQISLAKSKEIAILDNDLKQIFKAII